MTDPIAFVIIFYIVILSPVWIVALSVIGYFAFEAKAKRTGKLSRLQKLMRAVDQMEDNSEETE